METQTKNENKQKTATATTRKVFGIEATHGLCISSNPCGPAFFLAKVFARAAQNLHPRRQSFFSYIAADFALRLGSNNERSG